MIPAQWFIMSGMNDPQSIDPRRRIRELLAIPDRDRTDEEWDELNELEIRTAPGNRESDAKGDRYLGKRPVQANPGGQPRRTDRRPNKPNSQNSQNAQNSQGNFNSPNNSGNSGNSNNSNNSNQGNSGNQPGRNHGPYGPRAPDGRPDQPRPPKRQHRRPKRPPETPGNAET